MNSQIKVDGVSQGDVDLKLCIKNERERSVAHAQEEITDDDVFKELINIVMDVFSTKSEKCMLTFELPVESEVLKEITPDVVEKNYSPNTSNYSIPDITIPLSSKCLYKRRRRKFKVPTAKTSKYNQKIKLKKRLNSIVHQTALHPIAGFTDLEKLLWIHRSNQCDWAKVCSNEHKEDDVANGYQDTAVSSFFHQGERNALLEERLRPICPQNDDTDAFDHLCSEFKEILQDLEELAQMQDRKPERKFFGGLSYHIEEIQSHIGAIRDLLHNRSSSLVSIKTMQQTASTKSSEVQKRRNKVGVTLIRIGAKISQNSGMRIAHSTKRRKHGTYKQKVKSNSTADLKEILNNYHRVKKEETEIVRNLLGKLGYKDNEGQPKMPEIGQYEKRDKKRAETSIVTRDQIELTKVAQNSRNIQVQLQENMIEDTLNESQNKIISIPKPNLPFSEHKSDKKPRNKINHKGKSRKMRELHRHGNKSKEFITKRSRDHEEKKNAHGKKSLPRICKRSLPLVVEKHREVIESFRGSEIRHVMGIEPLMGKCSVDKIIRRVQSATNRLEYKQSLVEKKMNRFSKQQKELNKKIAGKMSGINTPKESRSNEDDHNEAYELTEDSPLKLSTQIKELIQPYECTKLGAFKESKPTNCHASEQQTMKDMDDVQSDKHFKSRELSESNQICSYVMELQEKEFEITTDYKEKQPGSYHNGVGNVLTSTVLTNEFKENSSSSRLINDPPASSLQTITTKGKFR